MSTNLSDFGKTNGTPISNKNTILQEIDRTLGYNKNPDIEYLLSRPYTFIPLPFGYGINYNSYGHSAVRYNLNGLDIVVNVEGKKKNKVMIVFYDAKEYLYGVDYSKNGEQRGVYNRNIVGTRIENVPQEKILAMHNYFLDLQTQEKNGLKKFNLFMGPVINFFIRGTIKWCKNFDKKMEENYQITNSFNSDHVSKIEYGNCAKWISEGLKKADICTATKTWPKSILVDIFENYKKSDVNIVCYQQPNHSVLTYGFRKFTLFESVAPIQPLRDYLYSNLTHYAKCTVTIPSDGIKAIVTKTDSHAKPNKIRNLVNNNITVILSSLIFGPLSFLLLKKSTNFAIALAGFRKKIDKLKNSN